MEGASALRYRLGRVVNFFRVDPPFHPEYIGVWLPPPQRSILAVDAQQQLVSLSSLLRQTGRVRPAIIHAHKGV